jgi:sugar-specific transcriptional regulator TrmB
MSDLGDLGLSSYEEAAYRALLGLGRATASEVAETGDVPKGRVYDVLNGLAARDLVRVHRGSEPRRYAAVDPETAVDRLLAERERELAAERERYADIAEATRTELSETVPVEGQFWEVGVGADDAVAAMREQFDRADDRLWSVVGPPYGESDSEAVRRETEAYVDLVTGGVEAKLLTTPAIVEASPVTDIQNALDTDGFAAGRRRRSASPSTCWTARRCISVSPPPSRPANELARLWFVILTSPAGWKPASRPPGRVRRPWSPSFGECIGCE